MKISKVDHTSCGVSLYEIENNPVLEPSGILFGLANGKLADRSGREETLPDHVSHRIDHAMGLYSVFNPLKDKNPEMDLLRNQAQKVFSYVYGKPEDAPLSESRQWGKLCSCFEKEYNKLNFVIKEKNEELRKRAEKNNHTDSDKEKQGRNKKNRSEVTQLQPVTDAQIEILAEKLVNSSLRKGLRRTKYSQDDLKKAEKTYDSRETMVKLVCCICCENYQPYLEKLSEEEAVWFLQILNKDYRREKEKIRIPVSIEKKVTKIRVIDENGNPLLIPSTADHKKKRFIFKFMTEYAGKDEAGREQMIVHIRQLILLYVCGPEVYDEINYGIQNDTGRMYKTGFGKFRPSENMYFSSEARQQNQDLLKLNDSLRQLKKQDKKDRAEIQKLKDALAELKTERKASIDSAIIRHYQAAVRKIYHDNTGLKDENGDKIWTSDEFWLHYINDTVRDLIGGKNFITEEKLSCRYLADKCFSIWKSYLAEKYIDYGKAVYHFTRPDLADISSPDGVSVGELLPEFKKGITSFDYERITAEEELQRSAAVYISFAVNAFGRAVCEDDKRAEVDILLKNDNPELYPDADRRLLQFFGGKSSWLRSELSDPDGKAFAGSDYFESFRLSLYALRNHSFHYRSVFRAPDEKGIIAALVTGESRRLGSIYRKMYYTANVPMFYPVSRINNMMENLYNTPKIIPAEVPAFKHIVPRAEFLHFITGRNHSVNWSVDTASLNEIINSEAEDSESKYLAALYFMMKEIYYNGFLQADAKRYFKDSLDWIKRNEKDRKKKFAANNFSDRVNSMPSEYSLGQICQTLTTEYMLQNRGNQLADDSTNTSQQDEKIYEYYMQLMYKCIREGFLQYLNREEYISPEGQKKKMWGFLRLPVVKQLPDEDKFCDKWPVKLYNGILEDIEQDDWLRAWYVAGHFMNPKHLSHMTGRVRYYIQYLEKIDERAGLTGNRVSADTGAKCRRAGRLIRVLEFIQHFCGRITNFAPDYFGTVNAPYKSEEPDDAELISAQNEYARNLYQYVHFTDHTDNLPTELVNFCDQDADGSPDGKVRIYHDPKNPVLNRNVVRAMLYGTTPVLVSCISKVEPEEIFKLYKLRKELENVLRNNICSDETELRNYKHYQNLKNRVELVDLNIYAEMINDLFAHLVSWCHIRERDRMYLQLGFHYCRLKFTGEAEDFCRQLEGDNIHVKDGAILYNIAALYDYGLPVITRNSRLDQKAEAQKAGTSAKNKKKHFEWYCQDGGVLYHSGLEFFENKEEEKEITGIRNSIDHFNYFTRNSHSILDLYSEMYNRMLTYNQNYRKSVSYVLPNTLMRYFVKGEFFFDGLSREVTGEDGKTHTCRTAAITLKRDKLSSGILTYKIEGQPKMVSAREEQFMKQVGTLLEYHNEQ